MNKTELNLQLNSWKQGAGVFLGSLTVKIKSKAIVKSKANYGVLSRFIAL